MCVSACECGGVSVSVNECVSECVPGSLGVDPCRSAGLHVLLFMCMWERAGVLHVCE